MPTVPCGLRYRAVEAHPKSGPLLPAGARPARWQVCQCLGILESRQVGPEPDGHRQAPFRLERTANKKNSRGMFDRVLVPTPARPVLLTPRSPKACFASGKSLDDCNPAGGCFSSVYPEQVTRINLARHIIEFWGQTVGNDHISLFFKGGQIADDPGTVKLELLKYRLVHDDFNTLGL